MDKKVFFEDARKSILDMFSREFPTLNISQIESLIGMFYHLANYEEESRKIRPTIILTSNINAVLKSVPNSKKIVFYEDSDYSDFKAHIKSLMCFCLRNWNIYINFTDNVIEYGIVTAFTSIKEKTLLQTLTSKSTLDIVSKKSYIVVLNVLGGGVCKLTGGSGDTVSVCFNLNSKAEYNWDVQIENFADACVSKIKTTKRKLLDIKNLLINIFNRVFMDLHGTICMVVDKDFVDKTGFLSDGTWLKDPIEFGKLFVRSNNFDESTLRYYADLITTMLDFDGITILDNAGRIRAYNVFIESNVSVNKIVGGARRRAAYSILQNKNKKIIGVYFQSQDGDNFYKEKGDLKKKKKITIKGGEVTGDIDNMLPLEVIAKLEQAKKKEEEKLAKLEQQKDTLQTNTEQNEPKKEKVETIIIKHNTND